MKLYVFPASPRAFKVLAVATHLGLDYELCFVDLAKGEQRQPGFMALNPNGKMPVLQDGDVTLWESNAIIQYLDAKKADARLTPADERERIGMNRWLFWDCTTWDSAAAILIFERLVKPALNLGAADPAQTDKGMQQFEFAAGVLDGHLRGRRFVCGDQMTLADFALGSVLTVAAPAQLPLEGRSEIRRWYASLEALPAWRAVSQLQAAPAAA